MEYTTTKQRLVFIDPTTLSLTHTPFLHIPQHQCTIEPPASPELAAVILRAASTQLSAHPALRTSEP